MFTAAFSSGNASRLEVQMTAKLEGASRFDAGVGEGRQVDPDVFCPVSLHMRSSLNFSYICRPQDGFSGKMAVVNETSAPPQLQPRSVAA